MTQRTKVVFLLERDKDGYPPVDAEGLWVELLDERRARIDNIPFFVRAATMGDVIEYSSTGGELRYVANVQPSRNSLIRVVCYSHVDPTSIRNRIGEFGCESEYDAGHRLIAVNIPPEADLEGLQQYLEHEEAIGSVGYEEPIITK